MARKAIARSPGGRTRRGFLFLGHGSSPPFDQRAKRGGWDQGSLANLAGFKAALCDQGIEPGFPDARNLASIGNAVCKRLGRGWNSHSIGLRSLSNGPDLCVPQTLRDRRHGPCIDGTILQRLIGFGSREWPEAAGSGRKSGILISG